MKKLILLCAISFIVYGCNMNPNKEARIQQLESEIEQALEKIDKLETRVEIIEIENEQLESRILELENDENNEH